MFLIDMFLIKKTCVSLTAFSNNSIGICSCSILGTKRLALLAMILLLKPMKEQDISLKSCGRKVRLLELEKLQNSAAAQRCTAHILWRDIDRLVT